MLLLIQLNCKKTASMPAHAPLHVFILYLYPLYIHLFLLSVLQLRLSAGKTRFHLIAESIPHQDFFWLLWSHTGYPFTSSVYFFWYFFMKINTKILLLMEKHFIIGLTSSFWIVQKDQKNLAITIFSFIISKSKLFSKKTFGVIYRESTREVYMDWYDPVLFIGQSGRRLYQS